MSSPADDVYVFDCSFAQERIWFLDQLDPGSTAYTIALGVRMTGLLDFSALERALGLLISRQEALRTSFADLDGDGTVRQIVSDRAMAGTALLDVSGLPGVRAREAVDRAAAAEMSRPFALDKAPLFRTTIIRQAADVHVLLATFHHIISDGWSLGVFFTELGELYRACVAGDDVHLAPLSVQYADFAAWQRGLATAGELDRELGYWRRQLAGAPALLEVPADRPRPAVQRMRGGSVGFRWPSDVREKATEFARARGATLFMVVLAAFQATLARYTGATDILVGTPVAGRVRPELEGIIGLFVNTLVIRSRLDADPSFDDFVDQVRGRCLDAYEHQRVPFERLVEDLQPERSLSYSPIVQVLFTFQNTPTAAAGWPGLQLAPLREHTEGVTAKFDLSLMVQETGTGLAGAIEYNSDLYDRSTAARLLDHLRHLLEAALARPGMPVSRLPLLTAGETEVAARRGQTSAEHAVDGGNDATDLAVLVSRQAGLSPHAPAIEHRTARVTYAELDERSDRLAGRLRDRGIGSDCLVGVLLERSPELIVTLLAVLKAGGAYLPLDPAYPTDRLRSMLADAGASLVVSREALVSRVGADAASWLLLDRRDVDPMGAPPSRPRQRADVDRLAYVLYTSGSTGIPKGVMISHRNVLALLAWAAETFPERSRSRVVASTSICFDLSVFEIFLPLVAGGTVLLAENALDLIDGAAAGATLINTVPSVMTEALRMGPPPPGVTTVCLAGEPLPRDLVEALYRVRTVERVFNLYGPTEATTYATAAEISAGDLDAPTIGTPISGTTVRVLDRWLAPTPVGLVGDLYIGGAGVARGYLNRPQLTAERFVPDPYGAAGARLYRTGDLARWRTDGQLEYLGRSDTQVKLRGFRIELGEIEAVLRGHPAVRDAVVVLRNHGSGAALVGYVVADARGPAAEALIGSVRDLCTRLMPAYMVPAAFAVLDALPLTANGKVDRRALPEAQVTEYRSEAYVIPTDPVDSVVAGVWSEILGVDGVGVHDNFFARGGHSLLATQVVARLRRIFGVDLPLRVIFECPTVGGLADALRREEPVAGQVVAIAELQLQVDGLSADEVLARLDEQ